MIFNVSDSFYFSSVLFAIKTNSKLTHWHQDDTIVVLFVTMTLWGQSFFSNRCTQFWLDSTQYQLFRLWRLCYSGWVRLVSIVSAQSILCFISFVEKKNRNFINLDTIFKLSDSDTNLNKIFSINHIFGTIFSVAIYENSKNWIFGNLWKCTFLWFRGR